MENANQDHIEISRDKITELTSLIDQINQTLLSDPESDDRRVLLEKLKEIEGDINALNKILKS